MLIKFISYRKLKLRLNELGYNRAEIKSTVNQIRKFDKDIKRAVYFWLEENKLPGDANPHMLVLGKYSIGRLCSELGVAIPAAFIILQTSRRDENKAKVMLTNICMKDTGMNSFHPAVSAEKVKEWYKKYNISEDEETEETEQENIPIDEDAKDGGEENE